MMQPAAIRRWFWVHKWTSLISTLFLLLLCITGLPLIFAHELEHALGNDAEAPSMPADTPQLSLDKVTAAALASRPGDVIQYAYWIDDEPNAVGFTMAPAIDSPFPDMSTVVIDARTAEVLATPEPGLVMFLFRLHTDLFAGLPGKLFLGAMGLMLVASLISGAVLYAPFMRKLSFGTVRRHKTIRVRWLDLHNLLGIATLLWLLVVSFTGVINAGADLVFSYWKRDQIGAMTAAYRDLPPIEQPGSLQNALETARSAAPDMNPFIVAFPGTIISSNHHYMVFMTGNTPLTKRLGKPLLIDARSAELTDMRDSPWYLTALLVSQPLHFGDYGGLPLKIIWALLDLIAIVVLGSGVYLWWAKRRVPVEARLAGLMEDPAMLSVAPAQRGAL